MENKEDLGTRRAALLATTLAAFVVPFMTSAVNVALPVLGRDLRLDAVTLGWVNTVYLLAGAIFLVPIGKLADMVGRRRIFVVGTVVFTVTSLLCAVAPALGWLLGSRIVQGLGSAMIFSTGMAILTSAYPPSRRGQVMGINVAATYTGLSIGPSLGGVLVGQWGWRSIFYAMAPLGLAAIVVSVWKLRSEWAEARGERFDLPGTLIYALSLTATMVGLGQVPAWRGFGLLGAALLGIAAFVWWERRTSSPVLNVRLFAQNRTFALSNVSALINYSATAAVGFMLSLYLQTVRGLSPQSTGLVLLSQPLMMALFSPLAGRLSDHIETRIVASLGMGLTAAGLLMLAFVGQRSPLAYVVACQVVLGTGFAFFSSPNMSAIMGSVEPRTYGVASATLATMRTIGQMLSMGIATLVLALVVGRVEITPSLYGALLGAARWTFGGFAALCGAGVFASLARGNLHPPQGAASAPPAQSS